MFNLDFLRRSSLMGTTLRAVPSKSHAFSTNYHTCIAMPTWHRCAPPILFWHWPPFNLQHPTIYMPFRQIIMYILQCPHDIYVHLFCFDLHKFLLRSHAATCLTLNCGRGTSIFRQELVFFFGMEFYYGPEGRPYTSSDQRVRPSVRFVTDYFCWRVVVCVRFSSETTQPIYPMMIPINWGNSVDVQRVLHFDLDPSMTAGQGREILQILPPVKHIRSRATDLI